MNDEAGENPKLRARFAFSCFIQPSSFTGFTPAL
jgi:hypothetical protein